MQRIWVYVIEKGLCKLNMSLYTGPRVREMRYASYGFLMKEGIRSWIAAKFMDEFAKYY